MKRYLLGQLAEPEEERLEERLLSDSAFIEEFDIVVDEIAAAYVAGEFSGEEKERVEKYFLRSPERRQKVKFIGEMLRQVNSNQRERVEDDPSPVNVVTERDTNLFDRVRAFFGGQSFVATATTFATLVLVAGVGIWFLFGRSSSPAFATLELSLSSPSRSTGSEIKKITLAPNINELRIKLNLPDRNPPPKSYRADLRGENISLPRLPITEQTAQSLTVVIPAEDLTRGTYAIELNAVNENGAEEAIRGAYLFAVE